ncbi:phosphotransferase enzyme family protein [Stutzerimonas kirkiae]|uniref:Aminoglycoside phosphotransferase n=1 Tax=Stutzerimonas kirkiae TaxID=2211392 RepID=A0A4Q9REB4_9GAMM|nr:phosphotransferase [Stutzerimonas kirkiae]TBU98973.1 aminoglycoside phosphotransferase [Stutzerimonas kirkiae]TBV01623.1 aminoglycoside phosphotransferase [Stutzerimonas kirkiae]TBV08470.1 aminoglycoside phosphotransferase [Stutzerimonas kirkiae]TBV10221.1 aminoglycoside phosphotransferase [Stutzerimonas kirkiae]
MNDPRHDSKHTAHGLGLEPVEPDWPALEEAEVAGLLARYPRLGSVHAIAWHSPRPFSAAARVASGDTQVIVKRHHRSVRQPAWLDEEHRFVRHLHQHGARVTPPLHDRDGQSAIGLGDWTYEVLPLGQGQDLYRDALSWSPFANAAHARAAGIALGELHRAAEGHAAGARQTPVLVANLRLFGQADPLRAIAAQAGRQPQLARSLAKREWRRDIEETLLPFQRAVQPRLAAQAPLWTHNDWHASNLLWQDDAVASVLDFGLADRTFALFDLASAIERNCIPWLELKPGARLEVDLDALLALLAGYRQIRPLGRDELLTLADLLPLVHADFALSELVYFESLVGSSASGDLAYAYLVEHALWFHDREGAELLERLRQLARRMPSHAY